MNTEIMTFADRQTDSLGSVGETTKSLGYGKCPETGEMTKSLEYGKSLETGEITKSLEKSLFLGILLYYCNRKV